MEMQNDCEMHIIDRQGARSVKTTSFISTLTLCIFSITKIWNLHITNRNDNFDKLWNIFKHDFLTPPTFRPLVLIRSKRLHNMYTLKILSVSLQIKFYNSQIFLNSPLKHFQIIEFCGHTWPLSDWPIIPRSLSNQLYNTLYVVKAAFLIDFRASFESRVHNREAAKNGILGYIS